MKKIAIGILSSALILGACGHNNDNENSKKSTKTSSNQNVNNKSDNSNSENYKETTFSDIFKDGKQHLLYTFQAGTPSGINVEEFEKDGEKTINDALLDEVHYVKDNKGFTYTFEFSGTQDEVPKDIIFKKLAGNSDDENIRKFEKLQKINLNDYNSTYDDQEPLTLNNSPKEIKKTFYMKDGKLYFENFNFAKYTAKSGEILDDHPKASWKTTYEPAIQSHGDFPNGKQVAIKPFEANGKTYAGIGVVYEGDKDSRYDDHYSFVLITEVPKNTKIVLDKDTSNGEVKKYEDTEDAKQEKEKKNKEFDNL
ncbi:hypothetical protein E2556_03635 [Staphylococcus croceilyticus]|uniref:Lipoprotein n=1 Tax=Staphylococcus croceilyticus TaxID=319942 RepID=A0ABY2KG53_9STAP|nr:hypothetical protein [Staphylococcus croceilyticus]PNZ71065.1 hypothetical protein CD128_00520 [Staphylococcus croceilyticus]TGA80177.1 hypothetical protein E2556_03635 [Staphylococcus croceilyticus]